MKDVSRKITDMQASEVMRPFYDFSAWSMANSQAQSDRTIGMSNEITQMHRDGKVVISELMSGLVTERFAPEFELSRTTF